MYLKDHFNDNIIAAINPNLRTLYSSINYKEIENFVNILITGYSKKISRMKFFSDVNDEHVTYNETLNFLTHILEVGALKVIEDNKILQKNIEWLVLFSVEALDVALAKNLSNLGFLNGRTFYFGASRKVIEERVILFLKDLENNNVTIKSILNNYLNEFLFSKIQ